MVEFRAPTGTFDVLPPESARYERLVALFAEHVGRAGYGLVVSPMFEEIGVFQRVGESTDVVRKEMYDFEDKGGRHMALRPEGTAGVVRAYVQHRPTPPFKAWYVAPNFRYERPQAGRYRQHHQVGVEALGSDDPDLDVEVVTLLAGFYEKLGLARITLKLNSLGDAACRPAMLDELRRHVQGKPLCSEHGDTWETNPLRVLDCKRPPCREATEGVDLLRKLCDGCRTHFDRVQGGLAALGVGFQLTPRLVRGLDYYTRTTFEFAATALDSAQDAVGGGGRYDRLAEELGGPPTPGIGFGAGIERILLACDAEGVFAVPTHTVDVFVVDTTGGAAARDVTAALRVAGVRVDRAFDNRSWKAQIKAAARTNAPLIVSIEPDGWTLRTADGDKEPTTPDTVVDHVRKRL
jgi:histidyl-tRNA synthetase